MNVEETIKLLHVLKSSGVTHFKSNDFEVTLIGGRPVLEVPASQSSPPAEAPAVPPPYDAEATQRAQDLIDTLRLKDDELVNKLFPDGA